MRPVFEKRPVLFQQRRQMAAPVGLVTGEDDLVVGALHRTDAVHLYETQIVDELQQPFFGSALPGGEESPCRARKSALPPRSKP